MAYSGVLLVMIVFSFCKFAYAPGIIAALGSTKFANIVGLAVNAFDFGKNIFDLTGTNALEAAKQEILRKINDVLLYINFLQQQIKNEFFKVQYQLSLQKVDEFEQLTKNRIQDAENIIEAPSNEKTQYFNIFLDDFDNYLDKLKEILSYVRKSSQSIAKSPLEMVTENTNCELTKMHEFSAFVHNLVISGISLETMYKYKKYGVTQMTSEKTFWENELKEFANAVAVQTALCTDKFQNLYHEDITQTYPSLEVMKSKLEGKYNNKLFLLLELKGNSISVSNPESPTLECVGHNSGGICVFTCLMFYINGTSCDKMVAIKVKGLRTYHHLMSEDLPMIQVKDFEPSTDLFRPTTALCPTWDVDVSSKFANEILEIHKHIMCGSGTVKSEKLITFTAFIVFVVAEAY